MAGFSLRPLASPDFLSNSRFQREETDFTDPQVSRNLAVELARQHGVHSVAQPLRLDYMGLKKRLGGTPVVRRKAKPAFVELIAPHPATLEECVIEFESAGGGKMRIQWKTAAPPNWTNLLRAWRDAER